MSTKARTPSAIAAWLILAAFVTPLLTTNAANAASNLGPSNQQRAKLAAAEAARLLNTAPLPSGTTRLRSYGVLYKGVLGGNASFYDDPDQVTTSRFYLAPDSAYASAWLSTRKVAGHGPVAKSSASGPSTFDNTSVSYAYRATAVLPNPELTYTMVTTAKGSLEFRATADVTWTPRKSPYSQLSSGAARVVAVAHRGLDDKKDKVTTVVTTRRRDIASFVQRINALPAANPGVTSCPADVGATLTLRFYRANTAKTYAEVVIDPDGCSPVSIKQFSASGRLLGTTGVDGGATLATYVAHVLGIANVTGVSKSAG